MTTPITVALEDPIEFADDPDAVERLTDEMDARYAHLKSDERKDWIQHLLDLAYLSEQDAKEASTDEAGMPASVTDAIERLRAENPAFTQTETPDDSAIDLTGIDSNVSVVAEPGQIELAHVGEYTSFDGEMPHLFDTVPGREAVNLATRALHHRLRVLGLFGDPLDSPWGDEGEGALALLAFHLGVSHQRISDRRIQSVVARRSADARWLATRFMKRHGLAPLVVPAGPEKVKKKARLEELIVIRGEFVEGTKKLDRIPSLSDAMRRRGLALLEAARTPESSRLIPSNEFGLQLLQLLLWMYGFYRGRLDGSWGALSHAALEEALAFEEIERNEALRSIDKQWVAINTEYVFAHVFDQLGAAGQVLETYEDTILEESEYLMTRATEKGEAVKERLEKKGVLCKIWDGVRGAFKSVVKLGRRIYRGAKSVVLSAVRGLMKGVRWVTGAISDLVGPVLNFTRSVFTRIRQGIAVFKQALTRLFHFVMRRPIITRDPSSGAVVVSDYDIDADVVVYVSAGASDQLLDRHNRLCLSLARGVRTLLVVAASVATVLASIPAGPVAWLKVGFKIGKVVARIIRGRSLADALLA